MRSKTFRKWTGLTLSTLLAGGTLLPYVTVPAYAAKAEHVVISEVYGGGGNSGATYKNDFIELYNPTNQDISLDGWSVQYTSAGATVGNTYNNIGTLSGTIKAHSYYLVQGAKGSGGTTDLPTADAVTTLNLSGTAGKVALVKSTTKINSKTDSNVVDFVGFGTTANEYEGAGATPLPSNTTSVERKANDGSDPTKEGAGKGNGWDDDNNATDFVAAAPNPQNAAAPTEGDTTLIGAIRANDSTGQPVMLGQDVKVEGIVTVANNVLGTNSYYIQDASGGVNVYGSSDAVSVGDKVRVTGQVAFYRGLTEVNATAVQVVSQNNPVAPTAATVTDVTSYATAEKLEGALVTVRGKVTSVPASATGAYNVTVTDEANKAMTVRVMAGTGIAPGSFTQGSFYELTGIVGQYDTTSPYDSGYQLYPRSAADVKDSYSLELNETAIETAAEGADVTFTASSTGADTVTVYYKGVNEEAYKSLAMTKGEQQYTAVLPAAAVPASDFVYYIEAKNATSAKQTDVRTVKLVIDTEGPVIGSEQPANGTKVETQRPELSAQLADPSGVDTAKVTLSVDGQDVTDAAVTAAQISWTPAADLAIGTHTAKVTAYDKKGNQREFSWTFDVLKPFTGGNHYRGTTHNHTNISHDGAGTPEQALQAGQKYGYDWFAFSDHSHDIDAELVGQDTVDRNGMPERKGGSDWTMTKDLAKQYTKNGEYVVFPAFEMTSTTWGHSNVFGTDNFIERKMNNGKYQDLNQYYAWVLTYDNAVAQFNHPDMSANAFNNFMPYDKNVDKLFTMLEVGNGSGNYGYANAEKKFYSALDLGWHVAPTYGEDNHDGTWGQTMQRTVIVADDLSQESLLRSMRNYRVYFEEDPNFKLDMLANGQYMGSVINSKNLEFSIKGSDAVEETSAMPEYSYLPASFKSDDKVQKVELITNGGKVVDSITPNTKDFTWNPKVSVTGGQQWFVVKITQADGQRIYSAPIWTKEEPVDVRVSGVEAVGNAVTSGNPATLEAGISNLGTTDLTNVNVKFYADEQKDANLLGTASIAKVAAKGVGKASVVWSNPTAGSHSIIAVVDAPQGDDPADNVFTKQLNVKQSLGLTVMIDAAHKNENTSTDPGTYKNNFKSFTQLVQREGYTVVENTKALTADVLANVKVLVLTHPQTDLTAEENTAVANFVKNGGSLFLADKSNYNNNSIINNDLLEEMGATIRINNDGMFDKTKEGNFWSDPVKSPFAVRMHLKPVSNYITDRASTLEYYSGASLEKAGHLPLTNSETVTVLASGNETTYQDSVKGGAYTYDNVSDDKGGSAIPAVASETVGKGRIVVTGMNFINDKQLDESYTPKGNDELGLNAINWLADRGTKVSSIAEARKQADGTSAVVEGTVTTKAGTFYDAFYVQDASGGVMAFHDVPDGALQLGDKVRIYGELKTFENNTELEFTEFAKDVIKIGHSDPVQPKAVSTKDASDDGNQGLLVQVKGKVVEKYDDNSYIINDGSGDILVFTDGYIVTQTGPVPSLKVGDTLQAVGLAGKYAKGNRIRVRDTKELVKVDTEAPVTTAQVNPAQPASGWYNGSVTVTLSAADDMSGVAKTEYRVNGGTWTAGTVVTVAAEGKHTVDYRSIDAAGNEESSKTLQLAVDTTAPVTAVTANGATGPSYNTKDVALTFTAAENGSGTAKTEYRVNGGTWTAVNGPAVISVEGKLTVDYRSIDTAGNVENSKSLQLWIDKQGPQITTEGALSFYQTDASIPTVVKVTDNVSGVKSVTYTLDGRTIKSLQEVSPLTLLVRSHTLVVKATDNAGNTSEQTFKLETLMDVDHLDELVAIGQQKNLIRTQAMALNLQAKVAAIQSETNGKAQKNKMVALQNELRAQAGKSVEAGFALTFITDLQSMTQQLW